MAGFPQLIELSMARSKSSNRWLEEHVNDPYVKKAQVDGYRARAAYKLIELNEKDKLIRPGIASDILPMDSLEHVDFIQGDFTEESVFNQIMEKLGGNRADVVISDMAPNISGVDAVDQASSMYLVELALDMARSVLKPKGDFVAKVFHGEGYDDYVKDVRTSFEKVVIRKPDASRPRSREVYVVGKGFKS
jgi:23S rRNA (uridine2552-2'-O)-methyltransferase